MPAARHQCWFSLHLKFTRACKTQLSNLNSLPGIVAQLITNILLMKGTVPKRVKHLLRLWHFHFIHHFYSQKLYAVWLTSTKLNLNMKKNQISSYSVHIKGLPFQLKISIFDNEKNMNVPLDCKDNVKYLALINRAGGLYGRVLTEVVSTDRTQWGLYLRPRSRFSYKDRLSSVNKMFIIWQRQEQFCTNWHFNCEWRWAEFNSSKVCSSSLLFFLLISFLALTAINTVRWKRQRFCILVCNFFTGKHDRPRWENLARGQYRFQPIKFDS